jgi:ribosomal protein S18 acetylase RimI-like enzyme
VDEFRVRPMTAAEFAAFRAESAREYAAQKVGAGEYAPDEAQDRALKEIDALLPGGVGTEGMFILVAEAGGEVAGRVWVALRHPDSQPGTAWIYAIDVLPEHRGKGYGRALLTAAEQETARHGVPFLGLNVFGSNETARHLYESAGYEITAVQMRKEL